MESGRRWPAHQVSFTEDKAAPKTPARKKAKMTRCCLLRTSERMVKNKIAVCSAEPRRGVQCSPRAAGTRSDSSMVLRIVRR